MGTPPEFPLDVLVCVLSHLPPERTVGNFSARTLARFATCSRLFNEAASVATLWEPHYAARFVECIPVKEEERIARMGEDWRVRYVDRMELEQAAKGVVRRYMRDRKTRRRSIKDICELGLDVWDFLCLNAELPYPPSFGSLSTWGPDHGKVPDAPLTWRWCCDALQPFVSQAYVMRELHRCKSLEGNPDEMTFTDVMSLLSCLARCTPKQMERLISRLTDRIPAFVAGKGHTTDPDSPDYDEIQLCRDIGDFMDEAGYGVADRHNYRNLINHFPHAALGDRVEDRRTLPITLIYVFILLARRLGLEAAPTNHPGVVLGRVVTKACPSADVLLINPTAIGRPDFVMLPPFDHQVASIDPEYIGPASASKMLLRACRNIQASLGTLQIEDDERNHALARPAYATVLSIQLLLAVTDGPGRAMLMLPPEQFSINQYCTFSTVLAPLLSEGNRAHVEEFCRKGLASDERDAHLMSPKHRRDENVKYFVGMVFRSRSNEFNAAIHGWDDQFDEASFEKFGGTLGGHSLSLSASRRNQPFYHTLTEDGHCYYCPEDDIQIVPLTQDLATTFLTKGNLAMSDWFGDVQLSTFCNDRGRFMLSPELQEEYPEDEWYGNQWVKDGKEAASERQAALEAFRQEVEDLL